MPRPSALPRLRKELVGFALAALLVGLILLMAGRGGTDTPAPGPDAPAPASSSGDTGVQP